MTSPSAISLQEMLNDLVGVPYIRQGTPLDAIDGHTPSLVVEPGSEQEVSSVLAWCNARGLAVSPRGGGTKLGWGNPPRSVDVVISLERLNALVEHAHGDMTATVQAGMTLDGFRTELAKHGQMLALDVERSKHATIGGLIATNDSGALRLRYGGIRDQILGITIVRADGVIAHGGGRVVKNVAGYDLPKLFTGSLGSLGVITQATFRLYPQPAERREVTVEVESVAVAGELLLRVLDSTLMPTGLFMERSANGRVSVTVRFSGIWESVESQISSVTSILGSRASRLSPVHADTSNEILTPGTAGTSAVPGGVLKVSVQSTEIAGSIERATEIGAANGWSTHACVHAHGLGRVRWDIGANGRAMPAAVESLREALAERGGTVVILDAPLEVKRDIDVWGPATDALPLMRRVKAELDPRSTLNPGRLMGGI